MIPSMGWITPRAPLKSGSDSSRGTIDTELAAEESAILRAAQERAREQRIAADKVNQCAFRSSGEMACDPVHNLGGGSSVGKGREVGRSP